VTETQEREETYMVRRPVNQTVMQPYQYTTYRPVQTTETQWNQTTAVVDQPVQYPDQTRTRLRWLSSGWYVDPATGRSFWKRGGLNWVPETRPGAVEVRRQYVGMMVPEQVNRTTYVPQVVTAERPVTVTSYVDEAVTVKRPIQVTRMVTEEVVRDIPYSVQRPVTERVVRQRPVQTVRWEQQEMVRRVPVTTQRIVYEDRVEETTVKVQRIVPETRVVETPTWIPRWKAVTEVRRVPRVVAFREPLYGQALSGATVVPAPAEAAPVESQRPDGSDATTIPSLDPPSELDGNDTFSPVRIPEPPSENEANGQAPLPPAAT
jgi:hypothetical protein